MAQVQTIGFVKSIQDLLFAGSEFVNFSVSHDEFINDKTVKIPQAGALPAIAEDNSVYPLTVAERTDDTKEYDLIEFSLGAIRLGESDKLTLSYNKRQSIIKGHMDALNDRIGLRALFNWASDTTARQVETTGTATSNIAPPSGTSTRKSLKIDDLQSGLKILSKDNVNVSDGKVYCIMPADMYWDFIREEASAINQLQRNATNVTLSPGVINSLFGINIIVRDATVVFATGKTKKALGAAAAATDKWGAIMWHSDYVSRAKGTVKAYINTDDALMQGDVLSATLRFNSVPMRTDLKGIVSIIQG